ncbi:tetratricopeptide repeat protein [Dyadobacter helix]|nr:tetratricopeptide repeat protein [Dyadobacter sp. CECT 9275]
MPKTNFLSCGSFLLPAIFMVVVMASCQNDARHNTRIPPVVKKSKTQWQNDALESLTDLISRSIDTDVNYYKRARIFLDQEQYQEALSDINEAIYEQANAGEYFLLRSKINLELDQIDNALEDAERAEALQQTSPELYILLADIYQTRKSFNKATAYLNQAQKMAPYDGSVYYVKGMLLAHQGDSLGSLASLNEAINMNPRLLRAYEQSTIIHGKLNNYGQALAYNNRAIARFPARSELYFERAEIYRYLSKPDTAIIFYKKAISINPKYTEALKLLAETGISIQAYHESLPALEQLQRLSPGDKRTITMLGYCFEKLGNFEKAKEYYGIILAKTPTDQDARYGMWRIRQKENAYLTDSYFPAEDDQSGYKDLDTTRVKINLLQPRGTTNIKVDSSRKAKIE